MLTPNRSEMTQSLAGRFRRNLQRLVRVSQKLVSGKPVVVKLGSKCLKVCVRRKAIQQLRREVENSARAVTSPVYAPWSVVRVRPLGPFIATSSYIQQQHSAKPLQAYARKQGAMISVALRTWPRVVTAPKCSASCLIQRRFAELSVGLCMQDEGPSTCKRCMHRKDRLACTLAERTRYLIDHSHFGFSVPVTPMHGDFYPGNAVMDGNRLFLIDWEHASEHGSLLYDWWFLWHSISKRPDLDDSGRSYSHFLEKAMPRLGISMRQFDAFGHVMEGVVNLSRRRTRRANDHEIEQTLCALEPIASVRYRE